MKGYVLDANAVVRHFLREAGTGFETVQSLIDQAEHGQAILSMSTINAGEVLYVLMKLRGKEVASQYLRTLRNAVDMTGVDFDQAMQAATLKHQYKLGYADSYAAALAISRKATLVSADPSFEKLGNALMWLKLPRYTPAKN